MKKTMGFTYLCAVCFVLLLGAVSAVGKISVAYKLPVLVVVIRYFLAVVGNFVMHHTGIVHVHYKGKGKWGMLLLSGICYAGSYVFQLWGVMYVSSVVNGVMIATVPIWTEVIARVFLKEKTTLLQNGFLFLSAGSVMAMVLIGSSDSVRGIDIRGLLLLFIAFIMEAANGVIIRSLREEYSSAELSYSSTLISLGITAVILAVQLGTHTIDKSMILAAFGDWEFVVAVLFLGLGGTFIAALLKGYILQHMSALRATAWYNAATPVAVIFGVLFLKEPFYLYQVICTVLILAGVLGIQICKGYRQKEGDD